MAQLAEILSVERERADAQQERVIHLWADGSFYRAYEWSAWLCCSFISKFKVTRRNVKSVDADMLFIGFPKTSLEKFTPEGCQRGEVSEGHITLTLPDALMKDVSNRSQEFQNWRNTIPITETKEKPQSLLGNHPVSMTGIMKRVLEFNVMQSSPMDCMQFVLDVQRQLVEVL